MINVGDTVWVYQYLVQEIEEGVVTGVDGCYVDVRTASRERPYTFVWHEVFPTRDALCEHYRRIFK